MLCNAVAAELLVPANEFIANWQFQPNWENNLPNLATIFHVSKWVIARRALTLGKITTQQYHDYIREVQLAHKAREKTGGGTYYKNRKAQVSEQFARALVSETLSGRVLLRDAGKLLDLAPNNITKFAKELKI